MRRSAKYNRWYARVAQWRKKYGIPEVKLPYVIRYCAKCLTSKKIQRHHKGHEYYFACVKEEWYAARYLSFHPDDLVDICDRHHRAIHKRYEPVLSECNAYLLACRPTRQPDDTVVYAVPINKEVLESYRQRLVHICDSYLKRKNARTPRKQGGNHSSR